MQNRVLPFTSVRKMVELLDSERVVRVGSSMDSSSSTVWVSECSKAYKRIYLCTTWEVPVKRSSLSRTKYWAAKAINMTPSTRMASRTVTAHTRKYLLKMLFCMVSHPSSRETAPHLLMVRRG